jgi:hypothetical protein
MMASMPLLLFYVKPRISVLMHGLFCLTILPSTDFVGSMSIHSALS